MKKKIKINIELESDARAYFGKHADCMAHLQDDDGKKIGEFCGMVGGNYCISINGESFYLTPKILYNAVCGEFGLKPMP